MISDGHRERGRLIDFPRVSAAALAQSEAVARAFLPDGRRESAEWVARNPRREDHKPGSFKVNLRTGKWGDFATGEGGGDLVSLVAYLTGDSQRDAALRLADSLGVQAFR